MSVECLGGGGETAVRGTERNGFAGRRRTFCYNTVIAKNVKEMKVSAQTISNKFTIPPPSQFKPINFRPTNCTAITTDLNPSQCCTVLQ
jgi:hypothetical protein